MGRGIILRTLLLALFWLGSSAGRADAATLKEALEGGKTYLYLENNYLKIKIDPNVGGVVTEMTYKPTGRQESVVGERLGGICEARLGGQGYPADIARLPYSYRIMKAFGREVSVALSFLPREGANKGLGFTHIYTLADGASALQVDWKISNLDQRERSAVPWVHNIVGRYRNAAGRDVFGHAATLTEEGMQRGPLVELFAWPATNWLARYAVDFLPENSLIYFVANHNHIFQFYNTHFNLWHCMEMVYKAALLAPGKTWGTRYYVAASPALQQVDFATVELAASAQIKGNSLELGLSPAAALGKVEVRAEISGPGLQHKLPPRQASLSPDRSVTLGYQLPAPLGEGIYTLRVALFRDGKKIPLGREVAAFEDEVVITIVSGGLPKGSRIIKAWPSQEPSPWKEIAPRDLRMPVVHRAAAGQVWLAPSLERIFQKDRNVNAGEVEKSVRIAAARHDSEAFQLVLSPLRRWKDVRVNISPLKSSQGGAVTPAMSWQRVGYIKTRVPPYYRMDVPVGYWPDPLLPAGNFEAPGGENTPLWISVDVPAGTLPGEYRGRIEITAACLKSDEEHDNAIALGAIEAAVGGRMEPVKLSVNVDLTVWDFTLPQKPSLKNGIGVGLWMGNAAAVLKEVGCDIPVAQVAERLRASAFRHYLNPEFINCNRPADVVAADIENRLSKGMSGIRLSGLSAKDPGKLKEISEMLRARGWLDKAWVYSPFDEAPPDRFGEVREWYRQWREITPIKALQVYYYPEPKELYGYVNMWGRGPENSDWIRERQQAGDEFWVVNGSFMSLENSLTDSRNLLWKVFTCGFKGQLLWSMAQWNVNPWRDTWYSAANLEGLLYYPHVDGFLESVRLKCHVDSVQDYEYLVLLKNEAERCKDIREAAATVAGAARIYNDPDIRKRLSTPEEIDRLRKETASLIVKLGKYGGER